MVRTLGRWVGKVAVVTGASYGIGAATAERLVEEGLIVVGLARSSEKIEDLAKKLIGKKGKLYAYKTDLSKQDDIVRTFNWIRENVGRISILINNAGVLLAANVIDNTDEDLRATFDINVIGLSVATREAVKAMRENNIDGHIINVNSVLGHKVIVPGLYPASKFAVTALTESLRLELNALKSKIKITSLSPGAVDTPMLEKATAHLNIGVIPSMSADDIVDGILYVLSTPPHVQIQELTIRPVGEMS